MRRFLIALLCAGLLLAPLTQAVKTKSEPKRPVTKLQRRQDHHNLVHLSYGLQSQEPHAIYGAPVAQLPGEHHHEVIHQPVGPAVFEHPEQAPAPPLPVGPAFLPQHLIPVAPAVSVPGPPVSPPLPLVPPVPAPVPVPVHQAFPIPVGAPVAAPVPVIHTVKHVAVPVAVPKPYPVPVDRPIHVPVPVEVPVPKPYPVAYPVERIVRVDRPFPVHVAVPVHVPKPYPVPVAVRTHYEPLPRDWKH